MTGGIMKHVAYIEDENLHHVFTERIIRRIREVTGADFLTVISAGEFCANGFPILNPKRPKEVDSLIRKSWVDLTDGPDEKADASRRIFYEIDRRQQELLQD